MKTIITLMVMLLSFNLSAASCHTFSLMDQSQIDVIVKSYDLGKPHNFEHTLAAMSWIESSAGKNLYRKDIRGGSWGIYQSLLDNVLWREYKMRIRSTNPKVKIAPIWMRIYIAMRLKADHKFAAKHAILELQFWEARTQSSWGMWASYNGGYNGATILKNGTPKIPAAQMYAGKMLKRIKLLTQCKGSPLYGR